MVRVVREKITAVVEVYDMGWKFRSGAIEASLKPNAAMKGLVTQRYLQTVTCTNARVHMLPSRCIDAEFRTMTAPV
jgi:hypothetical protein